MSASKLMLLGLTLSLPTALAQTIPASEAAKHVGERETVCGTIAGEHTATSTRGTPTFIDLDQRYPHQVFTVLVWGDDRTRVGEIPASGRLCVIGTVDEYRGIPEIMVRDSKSWYVPK